MLNCSRALSEYRCDRFNGIDIHFYMRNTGW